MLGGESHSPRGLLSCKRASSAVEGTSVVAIEGTYAIAIEGTFGVAIEGTFAVAIEGTSDVAFVDCTFGSSSNPPTLPVSS